MSMKKKAAPMNTKKGMRAIRDWLHVICRSPSYFKASTISSPSRMVYSMILPLFLMSLINKIICMTAVLKMVYLLGK